MAATRSLCYIGFVFAREDGRPLSYTTTWKRWRRLLQRAGTRIVRPHDARHTAATVMLSRGIMPKVVSEMLGHSTVAMTMDVYAHTTPTMHREAAKIWDDIVSARPWSPVTSKGNGSGIAPGPYSRSDC